jgi:hypothetical protein
MTKKQLEAEVRDLQVRMAEAIGVHAQKLRKQGDVGDMIGGIVGKGMPEQYSPAHPYYSVRRETLTEAISEVRDHLNALIAHLGLAFMREPSRLVVVKKAKKIDA